VLVDTHVALWMSLEPTKLRPATTTLLTADGTTRLLSAAAAWEIAVKWRLGKLPLPSHPRDWLARMMRELVLDPLPMRHDHAVRAADLPDHHRDPFDRIMIAQAQLEHVALVTADSALGKYDVEIIAA
jgi:PIN domain nuclease of toxin-antitoxin system